MKRRWLLRSIRCFGAAGLPFAVATASFLCVLASLLSAERTVRDAFWVAVFAVGLALFTAGICRRPALGLFVGGALPGAVQLASAVKLSLMNQPLRPYDVWYLGPEALLVVRSFPFVVFGTLGVLAVFGAAVCWLRWAESPGHCLRTTRLGPAHRTDLATGWESAMDGSGWNEVEVLLPGQGKARSETRLIGLRFVLSFLLGASLITLSVAKLTIWEASRDSAEFGVWFDLAANTTALSHFIHLCQFVRIIFPSRSSGEEAKEAWGWTRVEHGPTKDHKVGAANLPDIFLVMEESTFDPWTLKACNITELCRPNSLFMPDRETVAIGGLRSTVEVGGTWMMEFATHSGVLPGFFGPAGNYAPFSIAPRLHHSLAGFLKSHGYHTIAIYPSDGRLLNSDSAYRSYGFDEFIDSSSLGVSEGYHPYDSFFFQAALNASAPFRNSSQPLFVFIMTIRNHVPYESSRHQLPAMWRKNWFPWIHSERDVVHLQSYLSRVLQSARALEEFRRQLAGLGRPYVLGAYGDHRPGFAVSLASPDSFGATLDPSRYLPHVATKLPEWDSRMRTLNTFYKVTSPLLPEGKLPRAQLPPILDIAYIGLAVLLAAKVPLDSFYASQKALMEKCEGKLALCDPKLTQTWLAWVIDVLKVIV
ncbi:hypothetical protein DFJ74DRAFT_691777 [Hyaloraphidium curvatum]|nr:hypothetical protein DFJ74DRAFT_691777 [Hyaloraphidium curvatum]